MISVIVPIYKVEPYLRQCIDSIINQTYTDLEILLIDDGSPDRCGEVCDEYAQEDSRIKVFHTENRGLSAARNLGLKEAKGEYIGFVDSDDWIESDMYEQLHQRLTETGADICICGYWKEKGSESKQSKIRDSIYKDTDIQRALIDRTINEVVWNKLYRHNVFQNIAFPEGRNFEDIAIAHIIMAQAKKVAFLSRAEYHHQYHEGSITRIYTAKNLIDCAEARLERYWFFKSTNPILFAEKENKLLKFSANGISRTWRWWHGCCSEEKLYYHNRMAEMKEFAKASIPIFGYDSWPFHLRLVTLFMRTTNSIPLVILYWMNQIYRKIKQ